MLTADAKEPIHHEDCRDFYMNWEVYGKWWGYGGLWLTILVMRFMMFDRAGGNTHHHLLDADAQPARGREREGHRADPRARVGADGLGRGARAVDIRPGS